MADHKIVFIGIRPFLKLINLWSEGGRQIVIEVQLSQFGVESSPTKSYNWIILFDSVIENKGEKCIINIFQYSGKTLLHRNLFASRV